MNPDQQCAEDASKPAGTVLTNTRLRPRNRMFLRVFTIFGGVLLAMTALYGMLIIPLQRESLLKVMYSQAEIVSRSIVQSCSDAMLTDDFSFIVGHNLQVLQDNKNIRSVLISPKRGTAMYITPDSWAMIDGSDSAPLASEQEQTQFGIVTTADGLSSYNFATPIRFSGVAWGAIKIDFDTSDYETSINEMYRQLLYISIMVVIAMLPIGYFFALWLTRPIATISRAASRVAGGDLNARVLVRRDDEIGQLSQSFNLMVDALARSQSQLKLNNQELERKVAERTRELDELNQTLDQRIRDEISKRKEQETLLIHQSRLAAMGEMIGAIGHQWRQPLNALSLVMQNIRMQHLTGRLTDESMSRMQEKSDQLVRRMSTTIDDFRNFFKPNKKPETFNLAETLQSTAGIMDGVFNNHGIELSLTCPEDIKLYGVPGEFSQVILNLLSNAKDAVQDSRQPSPRIHIHARQNGSQVQVSVEDNGGGIPEAVLHSIYDPYFTTKEEGKGTGIGLYMSKMIVENHMHGQLEAHNTDDGARFTITFDASDNPTSTVTAQNT